MTKIEDRCYDYNIFGETPLLDKSENSFLQNMFILCRNALYAALRRPQAVGCSTGCSHNEWTASRRLCCAQRADRQSGRQCGNAATRERDNSETSPEVGLSNLMNAPDAAASALSQRLRLLWSIGPLLNAYVRALFNKIRSFGLSYAVKENQALRIEYIYEDKIYEVYIPYEKKLIPKTLNQSLHIFDENKNIKNTVKQQPGVPYLISPWHLGGNSALLISLFSEKTIGEREKIY